MSENDSYYIVHDNKILQYTDVKFIGEGTYSRVYRCNDKNKVPVALKISKYEEGYFEANKNEAKIIEKISRVYKNDDQFKNHVITINKKFIIRQNGKPHFCMEMDIFDTTLFDLFFDENMIEINVYDTLSMVKHVLVGLNYIHGANYIHCDLKPENILIKNAYDDGRKICIADFGCALNKDDVSCGIYDTSTKLQTRYYRAPQIIKNQDFDDTIDYWSLGCIFYSCLTGEVLFDPKKTKSKSKDKIHLNLIKRYIENGKGKNKLIITKLMKNLPKNTKVSVKNEIVELILFLFGQK